MAPPLWRRGAAGGIAPSSMWRAGVRRSRCRLPECGGAVRRVGSGPSGWRRCRDSRSRRVGRTSIRATRRQRRDSRGADLSYTSPPLLSGKRLTFQRPSAYGCLTVPSALFPGSAQSPSPACCRQPSDFFSQAGSASSTSRARTADLERSISPHIENSFG